MPLVSIITPSWNVERLIGETIESVQAQTLGDWELLIADDCSTDNTAAVIESYAAKDPRIKLIRQPRNGGPALARQAAIEQAQGRFIAFLDSDDLWLPPKLERQIAFAREHRAALSFTAFRRINEDGSTTGRLIPVPASLTYEQLIKNTSIATLTALVDRDIAGNIAMKNEPYDDFCLWLSILKPGHVAWGLNEDLARYRVRGVSVSSRPMRSAGWVWHIYRNVEGLSLLKSAWCFAHWSARAWLKRREF
ncbi:glycosyltransferase family 2 protein [Bradyrhizobium canariense]|uniref:Teichuronic acid biosynthesis glycosyltransferase TuaG n=1 Tax=Bradyrhizobium canariense TaxID=255045 RepID=A0A1H1M3K2_9BRAD|nr:glycosyltransferase family 2 protein [Bradyrhizobium canariense]SDR81267.1 teichuronic acid biosynthesis glycosyltransferase TuaG [Bradyrhizobium canariense]